MKDVAGIADQRFLEEVKMRNDIADVISGYGVALKPAGGNRLKAVCPLHKDSDPSFYVDRDKQFFKCFGCSASGDVISFVMQMEKLDFPQSLEILAERAGIAVPDEHDEDWQQKRALRQSIYHANKIAARFFYDQLYSANGKAGLDYLIKRGVTDSVIRRFGVGMAIDDWRALLNHATSQGISQDILIKAGLVQSKDNGNVFDLFRNRVMFPILDTRGQVLGFGGRVMDDSQPKYLNSPATLVFDKHRCLFGIQRIPKMDRLQELILVEGYMDVLALSQYGIDNAVAALGTAFGEDHARTIARYVSKVVVCFDGDAAGVKAALRSFEILQKQGLQVEVLLLQGGKDPDEILRKGGAQAWQEERQKAMTVPDYKMALARKSLDLGDEKQRQSFAQECANILSEIDSPIEREAHWKRWIERLQIETGFSSESLQEALRVALAKHRIQVPKVRVQNRDNTKEETVPKIEAQVLSLLSEHHASSDAAIKALEIDDFSHPLTKQLFQLIKQAFEVGQRKSATLLLDQLDEKQKNIAADILMTQVVGDEKQLLPDIIKTLRKERLRRRSKQLETLLASPMLDNEQRNEYLAEIGQITKQIMSI